MMNGFMNGSAPQNGRRRLGFGRKNRSVDDKTMDVVLKKGGNIGGLVNDGNTCFMNSVLQSLSSSNTLLEFIQDPKVDEFESGEEDDQSHNDLKFTKSLRTLLQKLNTKHFDKGQDYRTNPLLRNMTKSPNKNFLMGYNQEDAQEFFQSLLFELEADFKRINKIKKTSNNNEPILIENLPEGAIMGQDQLGHQGDVYISSGQIDPNLADADKKVFKYNLLTPVDGLTAERIGCIKCGENGGIRYNVFSGLSLNLPPDNYTALKLSDLLKKWIEPELIEGVDCNRCALNHVLEYQESQLETFKKSNSPAVLIQKFEQRIEEIKKELTKTIIDDEIVKKLMTKNMVKKSAKSKQILISRPPPLLSIHINRSVFDPHTYRVRKNNARVLFPFKFDLDQFVASPEEINTDARFPMSKKEPVVDSDGELPEVQNSNNEISEVNDSLSEQASENNSEEDTEEVEEQQSDSEEAVDSERELDSDEEDSSDEEPLQDQTIPVQFEKEAKSGGPLVYQLRSVIVHYGTHNYGHYIAFRKFRGVWWRTSDEDIEIVNEEEVLSTPGVFMLFYELDSLTESIDKKRDEDVEKDDPVEITLKEDESSKETLTEQDVVMANL